jgi:hypothetical protein
VTLTPTQALRNALVAARDKYTPEVYDAVVRSSPGFLSDSVFSPYRGIINSFLGESRGLPLSPTLTQAIDAFIGLIDAGFDRLPSGTSIADLYMKIAGERIHYKNWAESNAREVKRLDTRIKELEVELKKRPPISQLIQD